MLALLIAAALLGPAAAAAKPGHGDRGGDAKAERDTNGPGDAGKNGEAKGHEPKGQGSRGPEDKPAASGHGQGQAGNGQGESGNGHAETKAEERGSGEKPGASGGDEPRRGGSDQPRGGSESRADSGNGGGPDRRRGDSNPSPGGNHGPSGNRPADPVPTPTPQAAAQPPAAAPTLPTAAATPVTPAVTPAAAAPKPPKHEPNRLFRAFAATEPASVLAATLEGDPMDAPPLKPFLELEQQAAPTGRAAAAEIDRRAAADPQKETSLPFSGFSLLALVLSGMAAITSGRRLHELSAEPAPAPRDPQPVMAEPLLGAPLPARRHRPPRTQRPHRTAIAIGAAAFAVTALAVARAR
jgi:hypothetical protein